MLVLAVDTALEACSAALVEGARVHAARSEPMVRGHQERLAPLVCQLLEEGGVRPHDIERIAVTRGPGSFTGLRVGLAFAKGLGLALSRPVAGVGTLEALADDGASGLSASVIDARRGQVYLQAFRGPRAASEPQILDLEDAIRTLINLEAAGPAALSGPGASLLAQAFAGAVVDPRPHPDPVRLAALAAAGDFGERSLQPLYLRPPDARLPA